MYVINSLRECNYLKRTKIELIENLFTGFAAANHVDKQS